MQTAVRSSWLSAPNAVRDIHSAPEPQLQFSPVSSLSFTQFSLSPSTMTAKAVLFTAPPRAAGSTPDGGADPGEMRTWLGELDKLELILPIELQR